MTENHLRIHPMSLAIRVVQIKATWRFNMTTIRMIKINKQMPGHACEYME